MKGKRLIALVVVGVVLVGGALVYKQAAARAKAAELETRAQELLKGSDAHKIDPAYVDGLFAASHPMAAKKLTGLLAFSQDENVYYSALFAEMGKRAKADNRPEVEQRLRYFAIGKGYNVTGH